MTPSSNSVHRLDKTNSELATYLHTAADCPTKSTFVSTINNGNFTTCPGLTAQLITNNLPLSIPTMKVHVKQEPHNHCSAKAPLSPSIKIEPEVSPIQESKNQDYFINIATKEYGSTYSNLTGIYPVTYSQGNQYIFICYNYDTKIIHAIFTKTLNTAKICDTTISMLATLTKSGHPPNSRILDNGSSSILKQAILKHNIKYQLVLPHIH